MLSPERIQCSWAIGDLQPHMRWTLFDWMLDVASPGAMDVNDVCLPLAFSIVDRYLDRINAFSKRNLPLLGMSALLIAAKMFDHHIPHAAEFIYYMDDYKTSHDLLEMETSILTALEYVLFAATECPDKPLVCNDSLYRYLLDVALLNLKTSPIPLPLLQQVCREMALCVTDKEAYASQTSWATIAEPGLLAVDSVIETLVDEKARVQRGKRTAVQRKHCAATKINITLLAFEQIPHYKTLLAAKKKKIITRATSRNLKRSRNGNEDDRAIPVNDEPPLEEHDFSIEAVADPHESNTPASAYDESHVITSQQRVQQKRRRLLLNQRRNQCNGITQAGKRCKNKAIDETGFCPRHAIKSTS